MFIFQDGKTILFFMTTWASKEVDRKNCLYFSQSYLIFEGLVEKKILCIIAAFFPTTFQPTAHSPAHFYKCFKGYFV